MHPTSAGPPWTLVLPLKATDRGKSRIRIDPALRKRLTLAMAVDTAQAAIDADAVGTVLLVVEDAADGEELSTVPGLRVHLTATRDLNDAIRDGLAVLGSLGDPGRALGPVAALPCDLPSLTAGELDAALAACRRHRLAVVADRQGTGTTLLAASSAVGLAPRYGTGSLGRHLAAGSVPVEMPADSGLRRDVDLAADLAGVRGPRTASVLAGAAGRLCVALGSQ